MQKECLTYYLPDEYMWVHQVVATNIYQVVTNLLYQGLKKQMHAVWPCKIISNTSTITLGSG